MKIYSFIAAMAAIVYFASALDASAQTSRLYFAGYAGLVQSTDQDFSEGSTGTSGDLELKNANMFAGALGLRFSKKLRIEAELGYASPDVDSIDTGSGSFNAGGDLTFTTAMLNLYYDFDVPWKWQPYVGAGAGLAWIDGDLVPSGGGVPGFQDDTIELAWQLSGGLRYRMKPNLALTGGYRYFNTTDIELDTYTVEYSSHEFRFGLEYDLPVKTR